MLNFVTTPNLNTINFPRSISMSSVNVKISRSPGQSGGTPGGTRQEPIKERFKKMVSEFITTELSSHYKKAK